MTMFAGPDEPRSVSARPERMIFLHLPKAAGTTLHMILDRQYGPDEAFTIDGQRVRESIEVFKQLPESERARIRALKGHMAFGPHHHLPRPAIYVTLLRDPVRRLISHYHNVRRHPAHYLHDQVMAGQMSLQAYARHEDSRWQSPPQTTLGAASLRSQRPCQDFPTTSVFCTKQHVREAGPRRDELDQDTLAHILEHNALDVALYQFTQELFAKQVRHQGHSFPVKVRLFRSLNWLYGTLWRLVHGSQEHA